MVDEMKPKIRVALADDHEIVRSGLTTLLQLDPEFLVIGESKTGDEALQCVEDTAPDVLILDLSMPGLSGLAVASQIHQRRLKTRVLVLSMHSSEAYVLEALKCHVSGFVFKSAPFETLAKAIRKVTRGEYFLPSSMLNSMITSYAGDNTDQYSRGPLSCLSSREREVFQLVAEGQTSVEIGRRLFISKRTVEVHRAHLMKKLGLRTETEVVQFAFRNGIMSVESPPGKAVRL